MLSAKWWTFCIGFNVLTFFGHLDNIYTGYGMNRQFYCKNLILFCMIVFSHILKKSHPVCESINDLKWPNEMTRTKCVKEGVPQGTMSLW